MSCTHNLGPSDLPNLANERIERDRILAIAYLKHGNSVKAAAEMKSYPKAVRRALAHMKRLGRLSEIRLAAENAALAEKPETN